jgi:hypothetical protein
MTKEMIAQRTLVSVLFLAVGNQCSIASELAAIAPTAACAVAATDNRVGVACEAQAGKTGRSVALVAGQEQVTFGLMRRDKNRLIRSPHRRFQALLAE